MIKTEELKILLDKAQDEKISERELLNLTFISKKDKEFILSIYKMFEQENFINLFDTGYQTEEDEYNYNKLQKYHLNVIKKERDILIKGDLNTLINEYQSLINMLARSMRGLFEIVLEKDTAIKELCDEALNQEENK